MWLYVCLSNCGYDFQDVFVCMEGWEPAKLIRKYMYVFMGVIVKICVYEDCPNLLENNNYLQLAKMYIKKLGRTFLHFVVTDEIIYPYVLVYGPML